MIDKTAALEGLRLYDEKVQEARDNPGSHPNIDIMLQMVDEDLPGWEVKVELE